MFWPEVAIFRFHTNKEEIINSMGSWGRDTIYNFLFIGMKPEEGHFWPKHVVS
jgi:hypothetical protein